MTTTKRPNNNTSESFPSFSLLVVLGESSRCADQATGLEEATRALTKAHLEGCLEYESGSPFSDSFLFNEEIVTYLDNFLTL